MNVPSVNLETVMQDEGYGRLPADQRNRVLRWSSAVSWFITSPLPLCGTNGRYKQMAQRLGIKSERRVHQILTDWKNTTDWRCFVDARWRNNRHDLEGAKSPRFIAWLLTYVESFKRNSSAALDAVHAKFMLTADVIPGFENRTPGVLPEGCSKSRLYSLLREHKKEITRARLGNSAVRDLPLLTTRVGLKPGQLYEFDDVVHDNYVLFGGAQVRVTELGLMDYASGCRIHWGQIPQVHKDNKVRQGIERKMSLMFLAFVLRYIGVHPEGCVMMMEHGTATLSQPKIDILEGWNDGCIKIKMGGIQGREQRYLGGFEGRGKGNPGAKGGIESSHNLIHNIAAYLPGQTGHDRNEPAGTFGITKEIKTLTKWQSALIEKGRPDLAEKLSLPLISFKDFSEVIARTYELINGRTDHTLEGWGDRTTIEYKLGDAWIPQTALIQNEAQLTMMQMLVQNGQAIVKERKLSPSEVWHSGKKDLVKIPLSLYVDLIGDDRDFGRTVTVRAGLLTVQDKFIFDGEKIHYLAEAHYMGEVRYLQDDRQYRVIMNPYAPHELIVLDDHGSILGLAPQYTRVSALDENIYERIGEINHKKLIAQRKQRARYEAINDYQEERRERNREVAKEGGVYGMRNSTKQLPSRRSSRQITELEDADDVEDYTPVATSNAYELEDATHDWTTRDF